MDEFIERWIFDIKVWAEWVATGPEEGRQYRIATFKIMLDTFKEDFMRVQFMQLEDWAAGYTGTAEICDYIFREGNFTETKTEDEDEI